MLALQQLRLGWGIHGVPVRRHRGRSRILWEDLERLNQEQIEEKAAEIAREEKKAEEERLKTQYKIDREKRSNKIKALHAKIQEINYQLWDLENERTLLLKKLNDEEDIAIILMLL